MSPLRKVTKPKNDSFGDIFHFLNLPMPIRQQIVAQA